MREGFVEVPLLRALDTTTWRPMHTRVTLALGVVWLLDAFEVAITGSVLPTIMEQWSLSKFIPARPRCRASAGVMSFWGIGGS